ncbi:MAG: hypothetical protein Q9173_003948 [Seirophora scorigena]
MFVMLPELLFTLRFVVVVIIAENLPGQSHVVEPHSTSKGIRIAQNLPRRPAKSVRFIDLIQSSASRVLRITLASGYAWQNSSTKKQHGVSSTHYLGLSQPSQQACARKGKHVKVASELIQLLFSNRLSSAVEFGIHSLIPSSQVATV